MNVSAAGRAAITQREGRILTAYRDSVGVWTIGVGHTGRMAPPAVTPGMTISVAQSDAFLAADLTPVEAALSKALKVPVGQNEFDAMASLFFNVGIGCVPTSAIIRNLNLGNVAAAAAGFDACHKPAAIIGRRNSEKAQFLAPDADGHGLAHARAAALHARAETTKADAKMTVVGGGTIVVTGAGVAAVTTQTAHAHWGWVIAGLVIGAALLDGLAWWWKHRSASILAANAATHAAIADKLAKPPGMAASAPVSSTLQHGAH